MNRDTSPWRLCQVVLILAEPLIQSFLFAINVLSSSILLETFGLQQGYFLRITFEKKSITWIFGQGAV